jgi:hypothetical protein
MALYVAGTTTPATSDRITAVADVVVECETAKAGVVGPPWSVGDGTFWARWERR